VIKEKKTFTIVLIDIDFFKYYNDTYGHDIGDKVLIEVADILRKSLRRQKDEVYRIGGEEIAVILQETRLEGGAAIAERMRKEVEAHKLVDYEGGPVRGKEAEGVTISAGVVAVEDYSAIDALKLDIDETIKNVMKQVDALLYKAKEEGGRNDVEIGQFGIV
jgi:diguanylate cyclase (GGDEF)-like protein